MRVLAERGTGAAHKVGPVSYHAKWVKGLLARHLLAGRRRPRTVRDLVAAVGAAADALDLRVEDRGTPLPRPRPRRPLPLTVVRSRA